MMAAPETQSNQQTGTNQQTGKPGQTDRARVATLMARIAGGDDAAVFDLYEEFGTRLAGVMRRHLRAVGIEDIRRDDLDGLVIDACLELRACSGAWRADGGALPWTWASARLRGLAAHFAGLHADSLDETAVAHAEADAAGPVAWDGDEGAAIEVLRGASPGHELAALLLDGLALVGSARDQAIVLELRLQADLGDPSPSHTVAAGLGASPDAVRQVGTRMRRRLRRLAASDERYAALADLPLVA